MKQQTHTINSADKQRSGSGKRLLAVAGVLGLLASGPNVATATDILFNGNLDIIGSVDPSISANPIPVGWTVVGNKAISGSFNDGGDSEPWCNVVDANGYGFFFKPFQGLASPPDLLTEYLYQDNSTTPNTSFTLSLYAAGEANFCAFFNTNSPPPQALAVIEFLDNTSSVISSNGYDLVTAGLPNGGPGSMSSFHYTTPSVTAPAGTVTVRAGVFLLNAYGTTGAQSFFVDGFTLDSTPAAGSPVITSQPGSATVAPGGTTSLSVVVSNPSGVTYQWQLYHTNIVDGGGFSGVHNSTLTITNASAANVGHYRVLASNGAGANYSSDAPLALQSLNFFPSVTLVGKIGDTYRVDYANALTPNNWIPLSTNKLTTSPQMIIDTTSPGNNTRFYRSVFLY